MEPIPFKQATSTLAAPIGDSECCELPISRTKTPDGADVVISKWKMTQAEIDEVVRTGSIWLWVQGSTHPPVSLSVRDPWASQPESSS